MSDIVTVFGSATCMPCKNTKRWLDTNGVRYEYVDVTVVPEALQLISDLGYSGIPVVTVENFEYAGVPMQHWNGFDLDRLKGLTG